MRKNIENFKIKVNLFLIISKILLVTNFNALALTLKHLNHVIIFKVLKF